MRHVVPPPQCLRRPNFTPAATPGRSAETPRARTPPHVRARSTQTSRPPRLPATHAPSAYSTTARTSSLVGYAPSVAHAPHGHGGVLDNRSACNTRPFFPAPQTRTRIPREQSPSPGTHRISALHTHVRPTANSCRNLFLTPTPPLTSLSRKGLPTHHATDGLPPSGTDFARQAAQTPKPAAPAIVRAASS
jgi:hypothetical protein